MRDPKRLLEGAGTVFERALLGAISADRPSHDLHRKMRLGIGLVGAGAVAKAASASFHKLALVGVVAVGLVTGGATLLKRERDATRAMPAVAPPPAPPSAPREPVGLEPVSVPSATAGATEPEVVQRAPSVRRDAKAAAGDIRDEIRLLDQARSAVRSGASARALRLLSSYEQRFPRGQFRQEVQVLRMEALAQSGDERRAAALAKRFLAEHPNSTHVERVENVGK
jgi:hypothetical protein